jgi:broad specificity phosphatase PhoE
MDHTEIEERQIPELYLRGQLPPDEAASFEEHYLHCQECLDRLELAESMERGFKRAAGQDAARAAATRQIAILAWLSRLGRSRQLAALAAAVLVVAVLPGLLGLREVRQRERELGETRAALEQERARSAAGSRTGAEAEQRLRAELERERQARASADQQLAAARRPQGNVPILFLDPERGGGEPSHRVSLSQSPGWIVLALTVDTQRPSYRAILRDAKGREVWRIEGLEANEIDTLTLSLPSTLLAPGDYTVEADGRRFTFRVTK